MYVCQKCGERLFRDSYSPGHHPIFRAHRDESTLCRLGGSHIPVPFMADDPADRSYNVHAAMAAALEVSR